MNGLKSVVSAVWNGIKTIPPKLEIFIYEPKEETKKRIITEKCS